MIRGFKRVSYAPEDTKLPTRSTDKSAGYDFYSPENFIVEPYGTYKLLTGVKAYMQSDEVLLINVRSSIGIKKSLILSNVQAVIDSDFYDSLDTEGNIIISFRNMSDKSVEIKKGDRIAQGIFIKYLTADDDKPLSDKRVGGVGSSGK